MEFVKEFDNEKIPADSPLYRHILYKTQKIVTKQGLKCGKK